MSYKVEIQDEYSFGQWFSDDLRFATETEAKERLDHTPNSGWLGILDMRVVASDDPVSAIWSERGVWRKDGQPLHRPAPFLTPEELRQEGKLLAAAWDRIVGETGRKRGPHA